MGWCICISSSRRSSPSPPHSTSCGIIICCGHALGDGRGGGSLSGGGGWSGNGGGDRCRCIGNLILRDDMLLCSSLTVFVND